MARYKKPKIKKRGAEKYKTTITSSTFFSPSPSNASPIYNFSEPSPDIEFDSLPLRDLLKIDDEKCPAKRERKIATLRRRRRLIIVRDEKELEWTQDGLFYELGRGRVVECTQHGERPNFKRREHHTLYIAPNGPLLIETLDRLKELLPNLAVFELVQRHGTHQELEKVTQLLEHYHQQLEEVSIAFCGGALGEQQNRSSEVTRSFKQAFLCLMTTLNRMKSLRRLQLYFKAAPGCPVVIADDQLAQCSLPDVASNLQMLAFFTRLYFKDDSEENENSSPDTRLLKQILFRMRDGGKEGVDKPEAATAQQQENRLELYAFSTPLSLRGTLLSLGPGPVSAGLRSIEIDSLFRSKDAKEELEALAQFARHSPNLKVLTVAVKFLSIWRLVEALVSLKELCALYISCRPGSQPSEEVADVRQLPALPSVYSLSLTCTPSTHQDYKPLYLETLFPNLDLLVWNHCSWSCSTCGYQVPRQSRELFKRRQLDWRQWFQSSDCGKKLHLCFFLAPVVASQMLKLEKLWMKYCPTGRRTPFMDITFYPRLSLHPQIAFYTDGVPAEAFELITFLNQNLKGV